MSNVPEQRGGRDAFGRFIMRASDSPIVRRYPSYRSWVEHTVYDRFKWYVNWEMHGDVLHADIVSAGWVVQCPYCPGAMAYEPGEPFFCVDCLMAGNDGYAQPVDMPSEVDRKAGEMLLLRRLNPLTMNWLRSRGEVLLDLQRENAAHSIA